MQRLTVAELSKALEDFDSSDEVYVFNHEHEWISLRPMGKPAQENGSIHVRTQRANSSTTVFAFKEIQHSEPSLRKKGHERSTQLERDFVW